jgi:hypothetical protein
MPRSQLQRLLLPRPIDSMKKFTFVLFLVLASLTPQELFALDADSDTSLGSSTFIEVLSVDGDFGTRRRDPTKKGIWNLDYTLTRSKITNSTGTDVIDNTSEFDAGLGQNKKDDYEYGIGLTYASTPEESLKDVGPNIYLSLSSFVGQKTDDFSPQMTFKLTLSELTYTQTFSTSYTARNGELKPSTGSSAISQVFPKLEMDLDLFTALSMKLEYTYYFYNRNVNDFLATLDSPRSVAVGLGNLSGAVSGFNTDLKEIDFTILPVDRWEIDLQDTETTSAIDSSAGWTFKEGVLFDFTKHWRGGLAYQYVTNSLLTDHVYTASVKFTTD